MDAVVADQRYVGVDNVTISSNVGLVIFEFHEQSFRTRPEAMVYRYRLTGRHDWKNAKERRVEYLELPPGYYTFEVQAVDQHLVYSKPATITLTVEPDPQLVAMQAEINHLRSEVSQKYDFNSIIGESMAIGQVHALMERAIDSGLEVLIIGETGTGKELVAKAIHYNNPRKDYPLKDLNCGAVPKELVSSTLFGHRKGAFTGATEDRTGLFEAASGGTLLLDEIGEMPQDAQFHLLRVLEMLKGYSWPGNVRELEHEIHRAFALAEDGTYIQTYHFSSQLTHGESLIQGIISEKMGLSASIDLLQRRLIENALRECNGNRTLAARMLNTQRPNLLRIMKRLGIE